MGETHSSDEPRASAPPQSRLPFTRGYPRDPELDALVQAFSRGDYLTVRERAPIVAQQSARPDVRKAALDLRRRIDPDPLQVRLLLLTLALLAFLTVWFYLHKH